MSESLPTGGASSPRTPQSLRFRLLWLTLGGIALAMLLVGLALTALFREHVVNQFQAALARQLDQLVIELEFDDGRPHIDPEVMLDPRLSKPYSGLYWQIDVLGPGTATISGAQRSRSLWDADLVLPEPLPPSVTGMVIGRAEGPAHESLLLLQRVVRMEEWPDRAFRLIVAGDLRFNLDATKRFGLALTFALGILFVLLGLSAWAQVSIGLRPLREMQSALKAVREGRAERMAGRFPQEVSPLVEDFNLVLERNAEVMQRARALAGNLAHALKTPLAVLENEVDGLEGRQQPADVLLLKEQLAQIRRQIDWHLSHARVGAARGLPGWRTDAREVLAGLLRVFERVFAERALTFHVTTTEGMPLFAGEEQDLQEILGNLLENACKWANANVWITLTPDETPVGLRIRIEDDGPGIAPDRLDSVRQRGVRLDEHTPGSGLGLAIVQDLVRMYAGQLVLENRQDAHGVRVSVHLPAVRH
ncbi:MAG: ATP-binding protein [Candidatus Dactylopiibacterium carminicum]|uniref:histidine kinase n=1 Tax=Candidatus Dactylopiibacterium carminicum TaxID=857335 RepID=A0A272EPD5_9RHOO|nr:HAMP domain-containing sensor histidine kinase [Candidatus Dactylopiibacterium carminicum]KAF7599140.1 sensor histidine kinase [Candidatus Dactylopiibacterium carminicum]PAS91995.1 MAG: ATP-binding protein [Candidatus Dactylopiibacterium carminicum]PAS99158.1 MAG: hypothetical protein BSR46_09635 [Candidatus Dactylopiibacterium carminicum]